MTAHEIADLGQLLLRDFLPGRGWTFGIDRAKTRYGRCSYRRRLITVSRYCPEAEVRDTILHEIAHVLAGPGAKHGPLWQYHARAIGARPVRCGSTPIIAPPIIHRVIHKLRCESCGHVYTRKRLVRRFARALEARTLYHPPCGRAGILVKTV